MSISTITKPTLTVAQIMADLDGLNNSDPPAATALLSASKNLSLTQLRRRSKASTLPDPPKFDKLGKRIVAPGLARGSSPSSDNGNNKGTALESPPEEDEDMRRAKELVELVEKKEYFTYMGTTGLGKSKKRVDEVVQKYAKKDLEERQRVAQARQSGVR